MDSSTDGQETESILQTIGLVVGYDSRGVLRYISDGDVRMRRNC